MNFKKVKSEAFLIIVLMCVFVGHAYAYNVSVGDELRLEVYGEPELAMDLVVDQAGFIEYPFVDKINVKDREIEDIKSEIVTKLKDGYFVNPQVTVYIKTFKPFFIQGEVKSPGSYSYEVGLTVGKAIALAGGLTERASKKKIYITRAGDKSLQEVKANMEDLVESGDVVLIKESFF